MIVFSVDDLSVHLGNRQILEGIGFKIKKGSVTALIGPNGAGKTTLVRVLSRTLKPRSGNVMYNGKNLFALPTRYVAKTLAFLPQQRFSPEGLCVRTLVEYGRFPHRSRTGRSGKKDWEIVNWALVYIHTLVQF